MKRIAISLQTARVSVESRSTVRKIANVVSATLQFLLNSGSSAISSRRGRASVNLSLSLSNTQVVHEITPSTPSESLELLKGGLLTPSALENLSAAAGSSN